MSAVKSLQSDEFTDQVLDSDRPVLVDFYADWCAPCRAQAPILEELARQFEGRVDVAKVDVDSAQDVARRFGIRNIPTLVLFDRGEAKAVKVGVTSKSELEALLAAA